MDELTKALYSGWWKTFQSWGGKMPSRRGSNPTFHRSKVVHKHIARKQDSQAETYNKKIHGNLHQVRTLVWFLNLLVLVPPSKCKTDDGAQDNMKVIKWISDATHRVQHVHIQPNEKNSTQTTRAPPLYSREPSHQLGTNLQMVDNSGTEEIKKKPKVL